MRERMSMKSKMLGALALLTLIGALFVLQSADQYTPTADAATGSIAALNVGTCLTTSEAVFGKAECGLSQSATEAENGAWEIRKEVAEVSTLYATYAHDPKTSGDDPRAILMDSDLLKISITDTDRDKRTGVLIGNDAATNVLVTASTPAVLTDPLTDLGTAIKDDLDDDDLNYPSSATAQITYTHAEFNFTTGNASPTYAIADSGNHTLNFGYISGASVLPDFLPGDFNVDDGAVVRFYGCLDGGQNGQTGAPDGSCDDTEDGSIEVLDELEVDEDASNGEASGSTAPWLGVNASVPNGSDIVILAIYYRTSNQENLVGGDAYYYCGANGVPNDHTLNEDDGVWTCDNPATTATVETTPAAMRDGEMDVDFTKDEMDDNSALLVQAVADGNLTDQSVNLYLTETKRFNGVYQGYLRLTDASGDGSKTRATGMGRDDWGIEVRDGEDSTIDGAAVLAVGVGPVTIEYRDSDGNKRELDIEIDVAAPRINVTSPANGGSSGDQSPDFVGTLEDTDSGLADKTFRLVVDNKVDGQGMNDDFVLKNRAPSADYVAGPTGKALTRIEDYVGYSTTDQFGIVSSASKLYDLGDDSCDNQDQCYILADEYDDGATNGTFDDDLRLDLQDASGDVDTRDKEFQIDFQAFVMDMAGNIGFSDSDPANPLYINDLGEKDSMKRKAGNVLGFYSAHIITLDEKDPVIEDAQSATGFYGLNADDKPVPDRAGVMVVFDGPIAPSTVSTSTFSVELDDGTAANVIDAHAAKNYAFLKLDAELASDATPKIDIVQGQKVEDMAGNETFGREVDAFDANDGISPKLTVTLSGGSGSGTGNEGPEKLTNDQITVHVSSDEALQGAPKISVVCSDLKWNKGGTDTADSMGRVAENKVGSQHDIRDYVSNRNVSVAGVLDEDSDDPVTTKPSDTNTKAVGTYKYTCEYDANEDDFEDEFIIVTPASGLSLPGQNWNYTWKRPATPDTPTFLNDGMLTVVAYGHDRSRFELGGKKNVQNWGSASAEFKLDTVLPSPKSDPGGKLQPGDGEVSKEDRPHVLIEFNEGTTVTLDSVELDGVEVADQFEKPQMNRFIYWPESLTRGDHEVDVEASDAAGNESKFSYEFTVEARGKFLIELQAGWNAISVPADPVDTAIGSVFNKPEVETVIGWDTQGWRIAVRRDGVWESNHQYGALNEIRAKYGYWVKSNAFIDQPVALKGPISRSISGAPTLIGIDTLPGWNFVGVIDQEGDQTEGDDFGTSLVDSQDNLVPAQEYLTDRYVQAYTWDPTFSQFQTLRPKDTMTIGKGVWVYYPEAGGIAP